MACCQICVLLPAQATQLSGYTRLISSQSTCPCHVYVLSTNTEDHLCWGNLSRRKRILKQQMKSQHCLSSGTKPNLVAKILATKFGFVPDCLSWVNWVYIASMKIPPFTSHKIYTWSLKSESFLCRICQQSWQWHHHDNDDPVLPLKSTKEA